MRNWVLGLAVLSLASGVFAATCDDLGVYPSTEKTPELKCANYTTSLGYGYFNTQANYTYQTDKGKTDVGTVCFGCVSQQDEVPWRK